MKGAEWKRPSVTVRAPKVSFKLAHCRNHRASALRRALAQYTQASNPAAFGSLAMPQQPQPQPQPPAAPAAVGRTGTSTAAERERPRPEPERGRPAPDSIGERARRARVRVSCRGCRCGGRCGGRCGPEWRARAAGASVRAQGGGRASRRSSWAHRNDAMLPELRRGGSIRRRRAYLRWRRTPSRQTRRGSGRGPPRTRCETSTDLCALGILVSRVPDVWRTEQCTIPSG